VNTTMYFSYTTTSFLSTSIKYLTSSNSTCCSQMSKPGDPKPFIRIFKSMHFLFFSSCSPAMQFQVSCGFSIHSSRNLKSSSKYFGTSTACSSSLLSAFVEAPGFVVGASNTSSLLTFVSV